ncbi:restriction endonuclease subunit S [Vibrio vulnificus]|uniref:restriction endonuclease subunit S n=1 Tax=Vibrio parahaemolyticus TaxID=670 RepID=UPI001D13D8F8|nr:restriction endonuclease subunit S [Vibrio parahaemolyticus]MCU8399621.1 restriction endonuclease subunit S [Vibrio vulnificus]
MTGRYKAYAEYKDSGVEWVGSIPTHWGLKKLKYLAPLIGEKATEKTNPIALEHIQSWTGKLISSDSTFEGDGTKFKAGDILFGKLRPYLAKVYLTKADGEAIGDFHVMRPISNSYGKFLKSLMLTKDYIATVDASTYGAKMPRASWDFTSNIQLPFCSEVEAEKIANFLDHETAKIDTLIDKQEKLIELLKEKRQTVISHAVTKGLNPDAPMKDSGVEWLGDVPEHWDVIFIKHLSRVKRGASPRPIDDPKYFDDNGEYAWTRIADVSSAGMYLTSTTQRLSTLGSSLSVRLNANELFLSIAGTVGKPCITVSKACIHDGFVYFPELKINNKFLYYIFDAGQAYLGLGKMGTQLNLNTDTVGGIKVGLPPKDEIEQIVTHIENQSRKYSELIDRAVDSIELMKERKTALISAAVTGKIDVRDWQEPTYQESA